MTKYTIYYKGNAKSPDVVTIDGTKEITIGPGMSVTEERYHFSKSSIMLTSEELKIWKMCHPGIVKAINRLSHYDFLKGGSLSMGDHTGQSPAPWKQKTGFGRWKK